VSTALLPYPGLRPFEEADHELFFGREEQVGGLLALLEDASLVAVVGASGSGKSSLVKAGLLPVVRQGFLLGSDDWILAVARPGEEPYRSLAQRLAAELPAVTESELLQALKRSDRGLVGACELAGVGGETRVLVVVDQFEELFGFRRGAAGAGSPISRDQAAAFVAMLLRTAAEPDGRIRVILTMRSDFIGDCEAFLGLPEAISRSQFLVPRLTRSQMEEAIVRPGKVDGAGYEKFGFEEGLVNRIVNDAGDRPDQLPLMQHALMRTWKLARSRGSASLLGHLDYEQAGTIEKALSQDADDAWKEIGDPRQRQVARLLFPLLCDVSADGQITRRRPRAGEVMAVTGASRQELAAVLEAFQRNDRNFLLPPAGAPLLDEALLDVSHEALLRRWDLFAKEWLEEERRDAAEMRRLAEQAELRSRGEGGLIAAADLARVRAWQKRISLEWSKRYVAEKTWEQVQEMIVASRRLLGIMVCTAVGIMVLLLVALIVSVEQTSKATAAQAASAEALVNSFRRTIGVIDGDELRSQHELEALWDLAELDSPEVRRRLLDKWFADRASFTYAARRNGLGLRAAGELDPAIRPQVVQGAERIVELVKEDLTSGEMTGLYGLPEAASRLSSHSAARLLIGLEELIAATAPADVAFRFSGLRPVVEALARSGQVHELTGLADQLAQAVDQGPDLLNSYAIVDSFKAAIPGLVGHDGRLEFLSHRLAERMERIEQERYQKLFTLGSMLGTAVGPLPSEAAAEPAARGATCVVSAMENTADLSELGGLSLLFEDLGGHLAGEEAERLSARGARRIADLMAAETDLESLRQLSASLRQLVAHLPPAAAARLMAPAARVLVLKTEQDKGPDRLAALVLNLAGPNSIAGLTSLRTDLAGLAPRLIARMREELAARPAGTAAGSLPLLWSLSEPAMIFAGTLEPERAAALVAPLADDLAAMLRQEKEIRKLASLAALEARLLSSLPPEVARPRLEGVSELLWTALGNQPTFEELTSFCDAMVALAAGFEPAEASAMLAPVAERLGAAVEAAEEFPDLSIAVTRLAPKLDPGATTAISGRLAGRLVEEKYQNNLVELRDSLVVAARDLDPAVAAALANRLLDRLTASAKSPEDDRLLVSCIAEVLAALGKRLDGKAAARLASELASLSEGALADELGANLSRALTAAISNLPQSAQQARLLALSIVLLRPVPPLAFEEDESEDRKRLKAQIAQLSVDSLVEALKWPLSVGEAEQLLLAELELRLTEKRGSPVQFGGNLGRFVEQAEALGISSHKTPAHRPRLEEVQAELAPIFN
jgi:hypothetical protein